MGDPVQMLRETVVPAVLRAVEPGSALARHWDLLQAEPDRVALLAFGKASAGMANWAVERLGTRLMRGLVVTRPEHIDGVSTAGGRVQVLPADHPLPTQRNVSAACAVGQFVEQAAEVDRLVVLISGGGSAQLSAPRPPLTLDQMARLTEGLLRSGATIREINCVRKHCELVKGGQLARLASPTDVTCFVLSDVLGDALDVIASGPFAGDPTTFSDAIRVLRRQGLEKEHSEVAMLLESGTRGEVEETPKPGDVVFERVEHHIVASNAQAVHSAREAIEQAGMRVAEVRTGVQGEAKEVGVELARAAAALPRGWAVVWGGETTVRVGQAEGKGGRNQELALACAVALDGVEDVGVVSLATDGVDGPTDAAGGVVDGGSCRRMRAAGVDPREAMRRHDSYPALKSCGALLMLGATGSNVNDVMVGVRV